MKDAISCFYCKITDSVFWFSSRNKGSPPLCLACHKKSGMKEDSRTDSNQSHNNSNANSTCAKLGIGSKKEARKNIVKGSSESGKSSLRKSSRQVTKTVKAASFFRAFPPKGKSRRTIVFKKMVHKGPRLFTSPTATRTIIFEGVYFQVGDVVTVTDEESLIPFYAQLRGFMTDQYGRKSAAIQWLLPKHPNTITAEEKFFADNFILGPIEDIPRDMKYFTFVCHAPQNYFSLDRGTAAGSPLLSSQNHIQTGFIWTRVGPPQVVKKPSFGEMFHGATFAEDETPVNDTEPFRKEVRLTCREEGLDTEERLYHSSSST